MHSVTRSPCPCQGLQEGSAGLPCKARHNAGGAHKQSQQKYMMPTDKGQQSRQRAERSAKLRQKKAVQKYRHTEAGKLVQLKYERTEAGRNTLASSGRQWLQ